VRVTNVALEATQATIADFFSFCGRIAHLNLQPSSDKQTQEAQVQFETASAARTALLLSHAVIVDKPIVVTVIPEGSAGGADGALPAEIAQKSHDVPDGERTKTSVVAGLLAAGYTVGADAIARAREYDEKHSISKSVLATVNDVDTKLHISETATGLSTKISDTVEMGIQKVGDTLRSVDTQLGISSAVSSVDTQLGISSAVSAAATQVSQTAQAATKSLLDTEAGRAVAGATATARDTVQDAVSNLRTETAREIERRQAASTGAQPKADETAGSSPSPASAESAVPAAGSLAPPAHPAAPASPAPASAAQTSATTPALEV